MIILIVCSSYRLLGPPVTHKIMTLLCQLTVQGRKKGLILKLGSIERLVIYSNIYILIEGLGMRVSNMNLLL